MHGCQNTTGPAAARGQQSAKHRLSLNIEPISDRNFRSLYRKIFWQLNSTSISHIAPLWLLNDFDNDTYLVCDTQPWKEVLLLTSYSCVVTIIATLRWASCGPVPGPQDAQRRVAIIVTNSCTLLWMIQKVDPKLQLTSKAKSLFKSCIDRIYSCIYEVGCRIITHIMIFSVRYIDDHVGRTETETTSVRTVHDSFTFH